MRQSLVLLFLLFFTSCWSATSKDQPSDQEAIEHFKQHKELFDRIKDLALVTSEYKSDRMIQELLKEADCKSIAVYDGMVFITYFSGGTVLSSTDLEYVYMHPFQEVYGDTIYNPQNEACGTSQTKRTPPHTAEKKRSVTFSGNIPRAFGNHPNALLASVK